MCVYVCVCVCVRACTRATASTSKYTLLSLFLFFFFFKGGSLTLSYKTGVRILTLPSKNSVHCFWPTPKNGSLSIIVSPFKLSSEFYNGDHFGSSGFSFPLDYVGERMVLLTVLTLMMFFAVSDLKTCSIETFFWVCWFVKWVDGFVGFLFDWLVACMLACLLACLSAWFVGSNRGSSSYS